jgi:hypothetical protein
VARGIAFIGRTGQSLNIRNRDGSNVPVFSNRWRSSCVFYSDFALIDRTQIHLRESVRRARRASLQDGALSIWRLRTGIGDVDAVDGIQYRLEFARRIRAKRTVRLKRSRSERLSPSHALTKDRGADVVIECSGSPKAVSEALNLVPDGVWWTARAPTNDSIR